MWFEQEATLKISALWLLKPVVKSIFHSILAVTALWYRKSICYLKKELQRDLSATHLSPKILKRDCKEISKKVISVIFPTVYMPPARIFKTVKAWSFIKCNGYWNKITSHLCWNGAQNLIINTFHPLCLKQKLHKFSFVFLLFLLKYSTSRIVSYRHKLSHRFPCHFQAMKEFQNL